MLIEHGYQTAASDFEIFQIFEHLGNNQFFSKFSKIIYELKNGICIIRTLTDEFVSKILSHHLEKRLSFAVLNDQNNYFFAIYEDFGIFPIFNFRPILAVQKVLGSFFAFLTKI